MHYHNNGQLSKIVIKINITRLGMSFKINSLIKFLKIYFNRQPVKDPNIPLLLSKFYDDCGVTPG